MDTASIADESGRADDALLDGPVSTLAAAIRARQVSAEEVTRAFLARIATVNPQLNAVVLLRAEEALAEAHSADRQLATGEATRPLHGVPITIKDSFDTAGVVSTGGTTGRAAYVPTKDATAVARLRSAGAILLGKTNTPELTLSFATENAIYGRTNNPYDPNYTPGGSSGGACAILAAGGAALDLGTDTGGSIRLPAHYCGIAGLKPTAGRVARTGHIIEFDGYLQSLTHVGPLARHVADLHLMLGLIAGPDGIDPHIPLVPLGDPASVDIPRLRVAYFTDNGILAPTAETKVTVEAAARTVAATGAPVAEARPAPITETLELFNALFAADGRAWIRRALARAGTVSSPMEDESDAAPALAGGDLTALLERWDGWRSRMLHFWRDYDVLLSPVNAHPAIPHEPSEAHGGAAYSYTMTHNLTGWPGAVVRAGTSPEGLPIGVQIVAPPWREDIALAVAGHLEAALGGWQPVRP